MPSAETIVRANLIAAWAGILLGFVSGMVFGLSFHRETWLGGYGSFKRRLYRLGHISFFGLAVVNFMFYFTARNFISQPQIAALASAVFILGAITMPACCFLVAHVPRARLIFTIPVLSLLLGAVLTVFLISQTDQKRAGSLSYAPKSDEGRSRITQHKLLSL